jgi:uncharacterized membrane protein
MRASRAAAAFVLTCKEDDVGESGTESIDIDAPLDVVVRTVADLDSYREWAEGVEAIEVLETDEDGYPLRSRMTLDAVLRKVTFELNYQWNYPDSVRWIGEPGGEVKHIDGTYAFEETDGGTATRVTYTLEIDPGFPVPGFMLKKARASIMKSALLGLKKRAESEA